MGSKHAEESAFKLIVLFPLIFMLFNIIFKNEGTRVFYFIYSTVVCGLLIIKKKKISKRYVLILSLGIMKLLYDYFTYPQSIGDAISFAFLLLFLYIYSDEQLVRRYGLFLLRKSRSLVVINVIYILGIIYTIIFADGYISYWGTSSLFGHYGTAHFLAYELLILFAMSFYLLFHEKKIIWLVFMGIYGVMMMLTTVRTVILSVLISIIYLFIIKKGYKKWGIALLGLLGLYFVFKYTNVFSFVITKTQNAALLGSATSSRGLIWESSYRFFLQGGIKEKLLGNGIQSLMNWNLGRVNMEIQAHNDFLTVLSAFGILSLIAYIEIFIGFCKCKGGLGVFFTVLVLIIFNGLYSYASFVIGISIIKLVYETINESARSESIVYAENKKSRRLFQRRFTI